MNSIPKELKRICSARARDDEVIIKIDQKKRIIWFLFAFSIVQQKDFKEDFQSAEKWRTILEGKGFDVVIHKEPSTVISALIEAIEMVETVAIIWNGHGQVHGILGIGGDAKSSDIEIYADPDGDQAIIERRYFGEGHDPIPGFLNDAGNSTFQGKFFYRRICLARISPRLKFVVFYSCLTDAIDSTAGKRAEDLVIGPRAFPDNPQKLPLQQKEESEKLQKEILGGLNDWRRVLNRNRLTGNPIIVYGSPTSTSSIEAMDPDKKQKPSKKKFADLPDPIWDVGVIDLENLLDENFLKRNRFEQAPEG